jgi:CxxC motif-containing protein (DUF1111 family)
MREVLISFVLVVAFACEGGSRPPLVTGDPPDRPLRRATPAEVTRFNEGDALFEVVYREADGLGPLFIRSSCAACHRDDGRGPGVVARMAGAARLLPHGDTERPYPTAGATRPLLAPAGETGVRVSYRLPPAVFGRGYLEAVDDAEIERLARAAAARTGVVRGRLHRLADGRIGRFGLKARTATLDDFAADAFQGDMGLTSPQRPREPSNPDGLEDDLKPGVDLAGDMVTAVADYVRLLEIPERKPEAPGGREAFTRAECSACHVPSLRTRTNFPVKALAGIDAPVYTDLLLHEMGAALADGVREGAAGPGEWRTPPLLGLRFAPRLMHDGRARTVEEAILAHAGERSEGNRSVELFRALPAAERAALVRFVEGL